MNVQSTNNQPNFRASLLTDLRVDKLLPSKTMGELKKQGGDDMLISIHHLTMGPYKDKFYFKVEDMNSGESIRAVFLDGLNNIVELTQKSIKAVEYLNKYDRGNPKTRFAKKEEMSIDEIIKTGEKLDKKNTILIG